jgi:hypothetical protein
MVRLREVLVQTARSLVNELRAGYPAEVLLVVYPHPDREASCRLQFPAERP